MGKHGGSMTAAAISKRMKAKGLGRLRWYCQMCEKQCRDENGFKNHTQSASHQRQLAVFSENPTDFISRFSDTFRKEFLLVLRRRYGTNMVHANTVYQEYIKDRDHLHMNATRWTTLSGFVMEMGREGYFRVEDREDGWWISLVDRDAMETDRRAREMDKHRVAEQQRASAILQQQLELAKNMSREIPEEREEDSLPETGPVSLEIKGLDRVRNNNTTASENAFVALSNLSNKSVDDVPSSKGKPRKRSRSRWEDGPRSSALEDIFQTEQKKTQSSNKSSLAQITEPGGPSEASLDAKTGKENDTPWVLDNIAVKIKNKEVGGGAFVGKKGRVVKVIDGFGAQVYIFDTKSVLELDQDDLETVIPKPGGRVRILRGRHRGCTAVVQKINIDSYSLDVQLTQFEEVLRNVEYEDVSRFVET